MTMAIRKHLSAFIIYLLLTAAFTYPLVMRASDSLFSAAQLNVPYVSVEEIKIPEYLKYDGHITESHDALLGVWRIYHNYAKMKDGFRGFFESNIFYPFKHTFYYSDPHITDFIMALPVLLITNNVVLSYNYLGFLYVFLSAYFMYLFLYHLLDKKYMLALIGGALFAFSAYYAARMDHILLTLYLLPLVFLCLYKFMKYGKCRYLWLLSASIIWQSLSTWNAAILTWTAFLIFLIYGSFTLKDKGKLKKIGLTAILSIIPIVWLAILYSLNLHSYTTTQYKFLSLAHYILPSPNILIWSKFFYPFLLKYRVMSIFKPLVAHSDFCAFSGFAVYILAILGIVAWRKKRISLERENLNIISYFLVLMSFSFILSIGPNFFPNDSSLQNFVYDVCKVLSSPLRSPARLFMLFQFSLVVFAVLGLDRIFRKNKAAAVSIIAILVLESVSIVPRMVRVPGGTELDPVYRRMASMPDEASFLELPSGEMVSEDYIYRSDISPDLIGVVGSLTETRYMYYSLYHGKNIFNGYNAVSPPYYARLVHTIGNFPAQESLDLIQDLNISYVVVHPDLYPLTRDAKEGIMHWLQDILDHPGKYGKFISGVEIIGDAYLIEMKKSPGGYRGYYLWAINWLLKSREVLSESEDIDLIDVLSAENINSYVLARQNLVLSRAMESASYLSPSFIEGDVLKKEDWTKEAVLTLRIPLPVDRKCFVYFEGPLSGQINEVFSLQDSQCALQVVFSSPYKVLLYVKTAGEHEVSGEVTMKVKLGVENYAFVRNLFVVYQKPD